MSIHRKVSVLVTLVTIFTNEYITLYRSCMTMATNQEVNLVANYPRGKSGKYHWPRASEEPQGVKKFVTPLNM